MKKNKIVYWSSTIIAMVMGSLSALMYFTDNPEITKAFEHLGFPYYFRIELGIAKLIGASVILIPAFPLKVKEWAYAGFAIVFVSAFIAHTTVDGISNALFPLIPLTFLILSNVFYRKLNKSM